ncbi:glutaredoxin family protein [Roseateles oligotrophus]
MKERLARPAALQQGASKVNAQSASLSLYQFKTCPFCIKVRQEIHALALPIARLDAQHDEQNRQALLQGRGATKVPCLKITEANGSVRWLSESGAMVDYLSGRFAGPFQKGLCRIAGPDAKLAQRPIDHLPSRTLGPATGTAALGKRCIKDLSGAVQAASASRGHTGLVLQKLEIADAFSHAALDIAIGHSVAKANNHGALEP